MSLKEVARLCADKDIKYQMRCRGVVPERYTIRGRLVWWQGQLQKESNLKPEDIKIRSYLDPKEDLIESEIWLKEMEQDAQTENMSILEMICTRLGFLKQRVERIATEEDALKEKRATLLNKMKQLQEQLESAQYQGWKSETIVRGSVCGSSREDDSDSDKEDGATIRSGKTNKSEHSVTNRRRGSVGQAPTLAIPAQLYKWGIKFSGDRKGESASEFLQRVDDFAQSRRVDEESLLTSMTDLLDGSAVRWFRRKRYTFRNYYDFTRCFIDQFEPLCQIDRLLEFIKGRKQQQSETAVQYVALIEDLFSRLPVIPDERERINIMRGNLLPTYIRSLALMDFNYIDDFERACKQIEVSEYQVLQNTMGHNRKEPGNHSGPSIRRQAMVDECNNMDSRYHAFGGYNGKDIERTANSRSSYNDRNVFSSKHFNRVHTNRRQNTFVGGREGYQNARYDQRNDWWRPSRHERLNANPRSAQRFSNEGRPVTNYQTGGEIHPTRVFSTGRNGVDQRHRNDTERFTDNRLNSNAREGTNAPATYECSRRMQNLNLMDTRQNVSEHTENLEEAVPERTWSASPRANRP